MIVRLAQAGTAWNGVSKSERHPLIVIKRYRTNQTSESLEIVQNLKDPNVVELLHTFQDGEEMCLIYEHLAVSLRDLNTVTGSYDQWRSEELAGISRDVRPKEVLPRHRLLTIGCRL